MYSTQLRMIFIKLSVYAELQWLYFFIYNNAKDGNCFKENSPDF